METSRVALVTAGSKGLGAAIARALARDAQMRVAINFCSDADAAEALVHELEVLSPVPLEASGTDPQRRFLAVKADMADRSEINRLVRHTVNEMGRLDVVVSNAGWTKVTDFMDLQQAEDELDWDRCFNVNVKSHLFLFQACAPHLDLTEGAFISTASIAGVKPSGSSLPYAVSKAALIHLCRSLAVIAAPRIRVNSVSPGVVLTDWGLKFPKDQLRAVEEKNSLKRFVAVEDVAMQVLYLANSKSVTGTNNVIDAGFSL
ncbi:hypothetical protein BAUCODRAFT_102941 [Baudoinia panamericana UAMH 10762]|uniref:Uncharacterized protein n=1 Tax=Baudoinia panamericana (strain UAMH 10762) TaxID=717646 RepID=M2N3Q1_BAUPA|nr:uncharacterized protein BAUCODRAFT_102941 [Baudoinia panamericana UAMH 10762]EMC98603.1 hypothetical protein BAUCODRAFT_102941 [Baudoinia panamericana UAMH 10762]